MSALKARDRDPVWRRLLSGSRGADGLALIAGIILPFAFSPYKIWPLALLAPALLFSVWLQASAGRAAWRGWLFGLGCFGVGVTWILESFKFSNVALPLALTLTLGFIVFLSLYTAAAGYLMARYVVGSGSAGGPRSRLTAVHYLALLPAGFVLAEWLRGWFLTGFGWLQLGYSQVDGPLRGVLPITGVYGVSLLLAVAAGGCAWLVLERSRRSVLSTGLLLLLIGALAAGVWDISWTRRSGEEMKVALLQGNIPQDQKWLPRMRRPTLERYLGLTRRNWDARLIIWPETAVPGTRRSLAPFLKQLDALAAGRGVSILYGIPEYNPDTRRAFNSTVLAGVDQGLYRKRHLVPFGEYLPLNTLLRPLVNALGIPVSNFTAGAPRQPLLRIGGIPLAMFICYEIAFGAQVAASMPEAELLATVSNDAWFGTSIGPYQHLQIARARAIETGRYLVRATNTGLSVIVDPRGRILARSPQFEVQSLSGSVWPMSGSTPYVIWKDWPIVGLSAVLVLLSFGASRRRSQSGTEKSGNPVK